MLIDPVRYRRIVRSEEPGVVARLARWGLRTLSFPYALGSGLHGLTYALGWRPIRRSTLPVVSVGNLTVGGAGKTPTVAWIARWLRDRDLRVAVLSRGYGADSGPNDEAMVLEDELPDVPHLQGRDRATLAEIARVELESEILVLDDGFQHRRLARDLDLVLIDATDPFGGGWQLPGGLLRESPRALRRADVLALTRRESIDEATAERLRANALRWAGEKPWIEIAFRPTRLSAPGVEPEDLGAVRGKRAISFCGIGNPESFDNLLASLGVEVIDRRVFADHHRYTRDHVVDLIGWARRRRPDLVLTTHKDMVKLELADLGGVPLRAVRIEASIERGVEELESALGALVDLARPDRD